MMIYMIRPILITGVLIFLAPMMVGAQVRYKDSDGVMHFVNSLDEVPDKYRASAAGKAVQPPPPGSAPAINWEQRARQLEQERRHEQTAEDVRRQREAADATMRTQSDATRRAAADAEGQIYQGIYDAKKVLKDVGDCTKFTKDSAAGTNFRIISPGNGHPITEGGDMAREIYVRCMQRQGHRID